MGLPGQDLVWPRFDWTGGGRRDSALHVRPADSSLTVLKVAFASHPVGSRFQMHKERDAAGTAGRRRRRGRARQQESWTVAGPCC